ncbi:MAG: general secretion pathway protein GspK [Candidatus Omnitrophica bacterium]|nr:general secretion pathway protein GspK [Candidatus Omnitrophota bacterium]
MNQRGTILMVTLWILAILMLLTVSLAYRARMEIRLASASSKRIRAQGMAREGIARVSRILKDDKNAYDALNEEWALSHGEDTITYTILDEERKININTASGDLIAAIPGMEDIASSIIDNKPFETMEEFLDIKGITPQLIQDIKPLTTVYGHGRLNLNTAPEDVLEIFLSGLGHPASLKDKIILYRQNNIFESTAAIKESLLPYGLIPEEEGAVDNMVTNKVVDVMSSCYRVSLKAVYEQKYKFSVDSVLFKSGDDGIKIIYWCE